MTKELPWYRQAQKIAMAVGEQLAAKASSTIDTGTASLKKFDDRYAVTTKAKAAGEIIGAVAKRTDESYGIAEKVAALRQVTSNLATQGLDAASRYSEQSGLSKVASAVSESVHHQTAAFIKQHALDQKLVTARNAAEHAYGSARETIKPYFPPESTDALLASTRAELNHLSACIMQISATEADQVAGQFGAAMASKITGIATSGLMLTLVSTFGTAGTGTAIASLSGAAATNATLAWVGGLLGGGMAAGAVLTGGLSVVVGLSAYKLLGSARRTYESLSAPEQRIVQSCWLLIALIDELRTTPARPFDADIAQDWLVNSLLPLQATLVEHADAICIQLDLKNAIAFRQHVLTDFQRVVIDGFRDAAADAVESVSTGFSVPDQAATSAHSEYVIGGVFYALMTGTAVDGSEESQLVLAALRRSDTTLGAASEAELSDYLAEYDADQLKGIASNVKGIYHEELWVHQYNSTHTDTYAQMYADTNHAGADVEILNAETHEVVSTMQLKATDSSAYVNEHMARYPDIDVSVTNETAERMAGSVHASGIDNATITDMVNHDLDEMAHNTIDDRIIGAMEMSAIIATGHNLVEMLRGTKAFPQSVTDTVKKVGAAGAATAITAYLFS